MIVIGLPLLVAVGCAGPIRTASEQELRRAVHEAVARQTSAPPRREITLVEPPSRILQLFPPERIEELEAMSGPAVWRDLTQMVLGDNLTGKPAETAGLSLREAVTAAVRHNLGVQIGSINPAIRETDVLRAEARFDAVVFTGFDWSKIDQPAPVALVNNVPIGTGLIQRDERVFSTGIRKPLVTGGQMSITSRFTRTDEDSPGRTVLPDPAYASIVEIGIEQPLLRGFGSEANLAEIRLHRNAHRAEIEQYRSVLMEAVSRTEAAYWNLLASAQGLLVRERLLERGLDTEHKLRERAVWDVEPAQVSDAVSRVLNRETDVVRSRNTIVRASNELKQLMNAPGLEIGTEIVLLPVDEAIGQPVTFNYADALTTALENRPEIRQALLRIEDASIRQMLADNLRLPALGLTAAIRYHGLDDRAGGSVERLADMDFIDYLVGVRLEFPIGNREAQAAYRSARLSRIQSVLNYQQAVQRVTRDVKEELESVNLNYRLLFATREARLAAAESLRTIEIKEEVLAQMTAEFLNLKFIRQEGLAQAELEEIRAMANYQIALSNLYHAMGLGLERNRIAFVVPDPE